MSEHRQFRKWILSTRRRDAGRALRIVFVPLVALGLAHTQTFSVLHSFSHGCDGARPTSGVIRDAHGTLYGTTFGGGSRSGGVIFKLDPSGTETVLHRFKGSPDGLEPIGDLVQDSLGNIYATTIAGGNGACSYGCGAVFKVDIKGKKSVFYNFTPTGGNGISPYAGLVLDDRDNMYGTTVQGGAYNKGTVFKLQPDGTEEVLYSFTGTGGDGANPYVRLVRDDLDNLYGATQLGGDYTCLASGCGTVFKVDKTGHETVLHIFGSQRGDGYFPSALVRDKKGNLYGTTSLGGHGACRYGNPCGTVFKINTKGKETTLHHFMGTDGATPAAGLVLDSQGNLYGTTYFGGDLSCEGPYGCGTVFKVDTHGNETVLHVFTGPDGANPQSTLVFDEQGNLYGTASSGGAYGYGTVFKLTPQ